MPRARIFPYPKLLDTSACDRIPQAHDDLPSPGRFRKKASVIITAEQWLGWTVGRAQEERLGLRTHPLSLIRARIDTSEGSQDVMPGDWIITETNKKRYPCEDAMFRETYAPIDEERS